MIKKNSGSYRRMLKMLDYGVSSGRLIAAVREDGRVGYWTEKKAPAWVIKSALSVDEIRRLRRSNQEDDGVSLM